MSTPFPSDAYRGSEQITVPAVPLLVIRHDRVTLADLTELFDSSYAAFGRAIAEGAFTPAGPALAVYHGDPATTFDVEIGFPVAAGAAPIEVAGRTLAPSRIPAGRALASSHLGGYDGLGEAWGRLMAAVAGAGLPVTRLVEIYVTEPGPDVDPATLRTDLWAHAGE